MKHILFYTDTPHFGGAEKLMRVLAKYLGRLGWRVSLACGAYSDLKKREDELKKVYEAVYFLPAVHKHDPRHFSGLRKLLARSGATEGRPAFDLLHIHLWNPGAGRYAFLAARQAKIPVVTTEHDPFELTGFRNLIKKLCLRQTERVIAISRENYEFLAAAGKEMKKKLDWVWNGIDLEEYDPPLSGRTPGGNVLLCVAELHPRKGQRVLFRAFKMLKPEMPSLQLYLAGTGPDEAALKQEYGKEEGIHFLGWREDVPMLMKQADALVLPSRKEAFGLVLPEAMISGLPVIAMNSGGAKDIIENGRTGILVPPDNPEALAGAIRNLLRNPSLKKDLVTAALNEARRRFSAERMAKETADIYRKVLRMD